ncbi:MAG: M28 family peptidase [Xanthomarina sp.]
MKNLFFLISVGFLLVTCKSAIPKTSHLNESALVATSPSDENKTNYVSSSELEEIVRFLASDELKGRNTGTEGIEQAALFIEKKLKSYNLPAYYETYRDSFKVGDKNAYNLVGFLEGQDLKLKEEIIIIGGHYDHIGYGQAIGTDSIANGANDNAAGTSAVLALAKYFTEKKTNGRSLMFVLFSGEEMGLLGSKHLANKLKKEDINLYTMLNFEMIGVPFVNRNYTAFLTGYDLSNMAEKMNEYAGSNLVGFSEISKQYQLFKASDNHPFYEAFRVPSQTISSCDLSNYDYYHHVYDEADQLDYNHMASLINQMLPVIEKMSQTATKEIKLNEK